MKKAKDYYKACMNMTVTDERGTEPMLKVRFPSMFGIICISAKLTIRFKDTC